MAAWTSVDVLGTSVASVDASGLAKANSLGQANISCTIGALNATATLQVVPAVLRGLSVTPESAAAAKGTSASFAVIGNYTAVRSYSEAARRRESGPEFSLVQTLLGNPGNANHD